MKGQVYVSLQLVTRDDVGHRRLIVADLSTELDLNKLACSSRCYIRSAASGVDENKNNADSPMLHFLLEKCLHVVRLYSVLYAELSFVHYLYTISTLALLHGLALRLKFLHEFTQDKYFLVIYWILKSFSFNV